MNCLRVAAPCHESSNAGALGVYGRVGIEGGDLDAMLANCRMLRQLVRTWFFTRGLKFNEVDSAILDDNAVGHPAVSWAGELDAVPAVLFAAFD